MRYLVAAETKPVSPLSSTLAGGLNSEGRAAYLAETTLNASVRINGRQTDL